MSELKGLIDKLQDKISSLTRRFLVEDDVKERGMISKEIAAICKFLPDLIKCQEKFDKDE